MFEGKVEGGHKLVEFDALAVRDGKLISKIICDEDDM